jgi:hypothetical protein
VHGFVSTSHATSVKGALRGDVLGQPVALDLKNDRGSGVLWAASQLSLASDATATRYAIRVVALAKWRINYFAQNL